MSKSKKNVNEKKPFLAILPVAIGLILIFGISLGVWAFSGPKRIRKYQIPMIRF